MGITQGVQVDIATRSECSQNWDQVFVECDTTGFCQDQRISNREMTERWAKRADGETQELIFLKCKQKEISKADTLYP